MTSIDTRVGSDELVPDSSATYDLIVCLDDRLVFHDHYGSPERRLDECIGLLTDTDVVGQAIGAPQATEIRALHQARAGQWSSAPDSVVNAVAKLCRRWGVQIYASTTRKGSATPAALFSVITDYGPGQLVAEQFTTAEARRQNLVDRVGQFFAAPGCIPDLVLGDEQRLAALVATFLMPATVTLTESELDESDGVYKPAGRPLPIH